MIINTEDASQLQNALDQHAIVSITDSAGKITWANQLFCKISGYEIDELIGQDHRIVNSNTHPPEFFMEMWQTIGKGEAWNGLVCNRSKNGELYWVRSSIVPMFDSDGKIDRYISIRTDVTMLIKVTEELRQAKKDSDMANRFKSVFLSNMSHELRTPLNAIIGFSELLRSNDLSEDVLEQINFIHTAGQHLLNVINEVLDLSRIESGNQELTIDVVDINDILDQSLDVIAPLARKNNIEFDYLPVKDLMEVKANAGKLQQVLLNLTSNAIKYNKPNGKVTIRVLPIEQSKVRICISDSGIGLTPENLQKLFIPFTRFAPQNIEGTGIGLTITKQLVELMGGTIGVESTIGVGSTFWIEFPYAHLSSVDHSDNALKLQNTLSQTLVPKKDVTILYIEDNKSNLQLVESVFRQLAHVEFLAAMTPHEGIEMAYVNQPDLILLDINLPEISGYEVLTYLRENRLTQNIPVVAVSANSTNEDYSKGMAAGFNDYLTKPIDIKKLLSTTNQYLKVRDTSLID